MTGTIPDGMTTLPGSVSPLDAGGNPAQATLSDVSFQTSDPGVFTVAADPNNPLGFICTKTGTDGQSATLTAQATATEPDGTQHSISGSAAIVLGNPPVPPAVSLGFTFGNPS